MSTSDTPTDKGPTAAQAPAERNLVEEAAPIKKPDAPRVDLGAIRTGAAAWIASADLKATALLAVAGALPAAVAFASGASTTCAERMFVLLFCLFAVGSIAASAGVLWPRTKRLSLLGSGTEKRLDRSPTYFGEMGAGTYDEFRAELEKTSSEALQRDAHEQTYIALKIARQKMLWMRRSIVLLATSLLLLAGFVLARAFEQPKEAGHDGAASGSNPTSSPAPDPRGSATKR